MKMFGLGVLWSLLLAGCDLGEALKGEDPAGTPSVSGDAPAVEWHVGYGTLNGEHVHEGMQTSDGGYIGVGQTDDGDMSDFLVVKVSEDGEEEWQLSAGQSGAFDFGIAVAEAADGFVIAGGLTVEGKHQPALMKLDADGELLWQEVYSDAGYGALRGVEILDDGSIIATGYTDESEAGFLFIAEGNGLLLKTSAGGEELWRQSLSISQGAKVRSLADGGFAIGTTEWTESDVENAVIVRTDASGEELWSRSYGGENTVQAFDMTLDAAGGFVLTGHTTGYGAENWDCIAIAVDEDGAERWSTRFGQPRGFSGRYIHDECYGIQQDTDGGFIVAGGTGDEYGEYSSCSDDYGCSDEWKSYVVRLSAAGEVLWQAVYGGVDEGNNAAEYIGLTADGGYIIFSDTDEMATGDSNSFGFMKLSAD